MLGVDSNIKSESFNLAANGSKTITCNSSAIILTNEINARGATYMYLKNNSIIQNVSNYGTYNCSITGNSNSITLKNNDSATYIMKVTIIG